MENIITTKQKREVLHAQETQLLDIIGAAFISRYLTERKVYPVGDLVSVPGAFERCLADAKIKEYFSDFAVDTVDCHNERASICGVACAFGLVNDKNAQVVYKDDYSFLALKRELRNFTRLR